VTDHRIGLTLHKLDAIVDGDLDELLGALMTDAQSRKLAAMQ
jgi:peptide chain release factor 1